MRTELLIAYRNIVKNKTNSIITIIGMSVGLACVLLIYLFVSQEYSYNNFFANNNLIYRLNYEITLVDGKKNKDVLLDFKLPEELKEKVPQIKKTTSYRSAYETVFKYKNQNYSEQLSMADSNFFKVFSFKLIAGKKEDLLNHPDEIVITRKVADTYLKLKNGRYHDLLGQIILIEGEIPFTISGVLEDIPNNSTIIFDGIIPSYNYNNNFSQSNNDIGNSLVFAELKVDADVSLAEKNIAGVLDEHYKSTISRLQQTNVLSKSKDCFTSFLTSLKDGYLNNSITNDYEKQGSKKYALILMGIALLILLIASCNYIILTLGQSLKKVGEVGVRKTLGAGTKNIFYLFFSESLILYLVSLFFGGSLCKILIPVFEKLAHVNLYPELINYPKIIVSILIGFFVVVILTSLIPGLIYANIRPDLKATGRTTVSTKKFISQFFVAFQYSISIVLIIVTIFISLQTNYLKNKSLGFSKDNILDINVSHLGNKDRLALNDLLKKHAGILNSTLSDRNFMNGRSSYSVRKNNYESVEVRILKVDNNYIPTLGIKMVKGNNFSENNVRPNDNCIVVNEKLVSQFEMKNEPLGKSLNIYRKNYTIIGVIKDFHFDSMKEKIEPLALYTCTNMGNNYNSVLVKFHPDQLSNVVTYLKKSWNKIAPDNELYYSFWDKELQNRYEIEERWSKIVGYSSLIAIIISLMGLFGLTILLINQRTKEIGIRKVNGARVIEVISVLNHSFLTWLMIALIIACPVAYYIVEKWLESFPYKVTISWWIFLTIGIVALLIALITVSFQSWRVATRNPVEALRYE